MDKFTKIAKITTKKDPSEIDWKNSWNKDDILSQMKDIKKEKPKKGQHIMFINGMELYLGYSFLEMRNGKGIAVNEYNSEEKTFDLWNELLTLKTK